MLLRRLGWPSWGRCLLLRFGLRRGCLPTLTLTRGRLPRDCRLGRRNRLLPGRLLPDAVADHPDPSLQPVHPGMEAALIGVGAGQQDPCAHQLQVEAGCGGAAHGRQAVGDDLGGSGQLARAHARDLRGEALRLVCRDLQHAVLGGLRHGGEDHQVPQPA